MNMGAADAPHFPAWPTETFHRTPALHHSLLGSGRAGLGGSGGGGGGRATRRKEPGPAVCAWNRVPLIFCPSALKCNENKKFFHRVKALKFRGHL